MSPCTGPANGACIDPNMLALAKLYPAANANPNATGGYNYTQSEIFTQNNRQWAIRGDYSISDATKVFVRYNYQREVQQFPVGLWWRNGDQVPYPTPVEGKNKSDAYSGSITHVFSQTMTNETVIAYTFVGFPNVFADPAKVARSNVGYGYTGLFITMACARFRPLASLGRAKQRWSSIPADSKPVDAPRACMRTSGCPASSDTLTKVWGNHTMKAGFFYEWIRNSQPANNNTNGEILVSAGNSFSYGNEYADLLTGNLNSYNETNKNRINDIHYGTYEFFGQDSWKATRKLTMEFGVRFTHFQPWIDALGFGYSIFDHPQFAPELRVCSDVLRLRVACQEQLRSRGRIPDRTLFYQPRFGAAYDVSGNGQNGGPRRLGPFLLSLWPVHQWPGCIGRGSHGNMIPEQLGRRARLPNQSIDRFSSVYCLPRA